MRARLADLTQALVEVSAGEDLREIARRIVVAARELTGARRGVIEVGDGGGTHLARVTVGDDGTGGRDRGGRAGAPAVLELPIRLRESMFGTLRLVGAERDGEDGGAFSVEDEALADALVTAAATALDNARLRELSERRHLRLAALHEVGTALLAPTDARHALQVVADRALELTDSDQSFLAMPTDPEEAPTDVADLEIAVAAGPESARLVGSLLPVMRSSTGRAFRMRAPCRADSLAYAPFDRALEAFGPALIVPLPAADGVTGVLVTLRRRGRPSFEPDQLALMTAFADQAVLALRLVAAQRESRELVLLADRDRIARDLHDHVIQRLFAAGLSLHGTLSRVSAPEVRARIDGTIDELQEVVADIRTAIFDLHEGADTLPLGQRLRRTVADLTADTPVEADVQVRGRLADLSPVVADHLDAVVREAVSNAVRHSGADTIRVAVDVTDRVTVEIADDGCGGGIPRPYGGLDNLAARAAEVGGAFELASTGGRGTRVVWTAPTLD
ncbi:sensor histidine kinase [Rhodococcus sp. SGAir0479]|uniref:sensor histidine kinase n=1 Tax=Rhodococcus sp. SGAir0479 TaxID=2567884 RepID=UPI0010CD339B|nr:GAF domain-containing sensor histidine kinase [Rhodococcus sp. SGAir0479]QCQ91138.1 GAF domain-containing protein [Rhodococcus sp. SGAir0479]